jgi:hypothetical protein
MICGFEKSAKISIQYKDYILPSSKVIRIQGYENMCLDELLIEYKEDDILTDKKDMPVIKYILKGKSHTYYPDIWVKSENKIIEVKSLYTYNNHLIRNLIKSLATRKLGFEFEFWIYTPNKKIFDKCIV